MHSEILSAASFACAEGGPVGGPPPGRRCLHLDCAAWNAGEPGLIPEPDEMWIPPPPVGSGKFGTPSARMHAENLTNAAVVLGEALEPVTVGSLADPPQAAIATTQPSAAIPMPIGRLRGMLCVVRRRP